MQELKAKGWRKPGKRKEKTQKARKRGRNRSYTQ
jgi:hypothetical protein